MKSISSRSPIQPKKLDLDENVMALCFPDAESSFITQKYSDATTIFEYGSGGSTVLAAKLGKTVYAVESDKRFAKIVSKNLDELPSNGNHSEVIWIDIGKTKKWGYPVNFENFPDFHRYPNYIWNTHRDAAPDTVLIDGRMRNACFLTTLIMTPRRLTLLFDDYYGRPSYHEVEKILKPVKRVGRMAVFDVKPGLVSTSDFQTFLPWFFRLR